MPSNPVERAIERQIAKEGGWEHILERLASAETQVSISRSLINPKTQRHISPGFFNRMLHSDPERSKRADEAMRAGASIAIDVGLEKVNDAPPEKDAIQKARVQLDGYLRVAALRDRERFGERSPAVNVQVNVDSLYLDALRHRVVASAALLNSGASVDDSASENAAARAGSEQPLTVETTDSQSVA